MIPPSGTSAPLPLQSPDLFATASPQHRAAADFVALFVGEVFKAMRATCHESDTSFAQGVFTSMLDEQLAKDLAERDGLGLQDTIASHLVEKPLKISTAPSIQGPG